MRADRLVSLMLLLHTRGRMTAASLAAELEVSERTIYRDIEALSIAGVPVCTQSGPSGGVYLDANYRVALGGLSRGEALSLFLSGDSHTGPLAALGLARAQDDSRLKLFAALPAMHRLEVERMRQRFHIDPAMWFASSDPPSLFPALQQAVWEDRLIHVLYQPVTHDKRERVLEAHALVAKANIWYLVARKPEPGAALHHYRAGRFLAVQLLEGRFARDPAFDLAEYWRESCARFERESLEHNPLFQVTLRVAPDKFWVFPGYHEGRYTVTEEAADGWRTLQVVFDAESLALIWLTGMGSAVQVLEPAALCDKIRATARALLP
jgi:predicted DNA-binding transcriptional regulator YafY